MKFDKKFRQPFKPRDFRARVKKEGEEEDDEQQQQPQRRRQQQHPSADHNQDNQNEQSDSKPDNKDNRPPTKTKAQSMKWIDLVKLKKARIIVRNLPFGITDDEIKEQFAQFGDIHEVQVPKMEGGKMKGFGFINFNKTISAIQAIKQMNGKTLTSGRFSRVIAVDYSLPKRKYEQHVYEIKGDQQEEVNKSQDDHELSSSSDESSDEEEEEEDRKEQETHVGQRTKLNDQSKFVRPASNDVEQGRTLFIRNLTFDTTEDDLRKMMSEFGDLDYCLLCVDKMTEHPKGTAFVKYKTKESADACLECHQNLDENEDKFYLDGRVIQIQPAITKSRLEEKEQQAKRLRDKRNLYLLKEGLIYPDSPAAEGVSPDDLEKRMFLAQKKKGQMDNLHYFVAKNRLCIHNLPSQFTDQQLHDLVYDVIKDDQEAKILFCQVIRTKNRVTNELKQSRGFGYVTLSTHVHALRVLRHLNNNPNVFSAQTRPIVEFSVENLNAIKKNKQQVMKESQEGQELEREMVNFDWAGMQAKQFGDKERVATPLAARKLKNKSKLVSIKRNELRRERRETKQHQERGKFIQRKVANRKDNKALQKKRKRNDQEDTGRLERQFLNKTSSRLAHQQDRTAGQQQQDNKGSRKKGMPSKRKWFE